MARPKPRKLTKARARPRAASLKAPRLGELIARNSRVLRVLDEHGITFCAGCYLTLMSSPERAAVYHAVPDVRKFLKDLERALR